MLFPEQFYRDRYLDEAMVVMDNVCLGNDIQSEKIILWGRNAIIISFILETQEKGNCSSDI